MRLLVQPNMRGASIGMASSPHASEHRRLLPPLEAPLSGRRRESTQVFARLSSGHCSPSAYHRSCVPVETPVGTTVTRRHHRYGPAQNTLPLPRIILPVGDRKSRSPSPLPSGRIMRSCSQSCIQDSKMTEEQVTSYLLQNERFLEDFVMNHCELETLERWVIRYTQRLSKKAAQAGGRAPPRKTSLSRWKFCVHADKRKMLQELTSSLYLKPSKVHVLSELAATIASAVNADSWNLFLFDRNTQELHSFKCDDGKCQCGDGIVQTNPVSKTSLATLVARMREPVRICNGEDDARFAGLVDMSEPNAAYILAHPIVQPDGELTGVLELYRKADSPRFYDEDEEIVNSYLVWGGIALHYAEMYSTMARQRKLHSFLLAVVRSIFQDMVSMDSVIVKIMTFAQKLVSADRASLFLVDNRTKELYARIFDVSGDPDNGGTHEVAKEIRNLQMCAVPRFPIGTGIAGHVALTGESLNIPNAYDDDRFNRAVDQQTGYTTKSLLCMPIFIRGSVIGVVQMVNKTTGTFNRNDEEAFTTFATYCGLALHHAKLYDKIRRSEQKYKVALEVLSYHATCTDEEVMRIEAAPPLPHPGEELRHFSYSTYSLMSDEKVVATIFMFKDLFQSDMFEESSLIRFTLTVRKNYRRVPYHNWAHGFCVANAAYAILKHSPGTFKPLEELALFVSCLCHDLDHRGKTNQFLINSASPLASIYTTSTLEHHHFNQTVQILQQSGHNILKNLSSEDYKQVLSLIKHCILATDLALYFPNKAKLKRLVDEGAYDPGNVEHRQLLQAIAMTSCDLCASTKPWEQQRETVRVIFEEFYEQGDVEKAEGRQPIPMMDRSKAQELPASQVGFLKNICIPCYELLAMVVPGTDDMKKGCLDNLKLWEELAAIEDSKLEKGDDT
ncbi:probable 3',5'-cyclic phosphodiesterase pde-5 isoform X3 [Ornithodoros turicata]|uniref:probable 3',5'-cyclic phosphodiesterase pde-5 isoform X3 n=1 Tax=Ornithodoros turicata TaxID=34597 RepID=UPI0031394643